LTHVRANGAMRERAPEGFVVGVGGVWQFCRPCLPPPPSFEGVLRVEGKMLHPYPQGYEGDGGRHMGQRAASGARVMGPGRWAA